ncbi:MAG TPA: aspartate/glutamate racemase family protein [Candidatus Paceibacterota bacterium]|nr:aspartate/glutamate racemase family protein [Candidatus Paceibacterota bacterium]
MIGIFDSGSGGLTVLKAIRAELPTADIVYFGDIKNAPYGSKTNRELSTLTVHAIELLQKEGAESIVSACNSVSATLAISLFDAFSIAPDHLIEMVGPTVHAFKNTTKRILLVATPATIHSEIYQNAFRMIGKDIQAIAIPDLAKAIEFGSSEEKIEQIIREAFSAIPTESFEVLILACTHYPLVAPIFTRVLGDIPVLFDPATEVGARAKRQLGAREVGKGTTRFLISQDSQLFRDRVAALHLTPTPDIEVVG